MIEEIHQTENNTLEIIHKIEDQIEINITTITIKTD